MKTTLKQRKQLEKDNNKYTLVLQEIPKEMWPSNPSNLLRVLRSRNFLVQEFTSESPAIVRLSVCKTSIKGDRFKDGISWDELQKIKHESGYSNYDAIEIFPRDEDIVNVANMRHLWIMNDLISFAWRKN